MMKAKNIKMVVSEDVEERREDVREAVEGFADRFEPLEADALYVLADSRTDAPFCECHIKASKLIPMGTTHVPLDPDDQGEYRANRDIVEDHGAYRKMQTDALGGRAFSNIVAEFDDSEESDLPLKVIGGQHRFEAIKQALESGVDEYHGVKVYFGLDTEQRLDVQLISNTNIAASADLLDRMNETVSGPDLRDWCQRVGLLYEGQDFADKKARTKPITVREARTFIINYYRGREVEPEAFNTTSTTPIVAKTGELVPEWDELKKQRTGLWEDKKLDEAGREFALLAQAQSDYFEDPRRRSNKNADFANKTFNFAVLSAWAFVAGMLHANETRLQRHFALRKHKSKDPLNAAALATGRHKTDPEQYRGLGYRMDAKERGRFVELFYIQADKGGGLTKGMVDLAVKQYHAKQAFLEVQKAQARV